MRQFWQNLRQRERWLLLFCAAVVLVAALVTALSPWHDKLQRLRAEVPQQHQELAWMLGASAEAARLRAAGADQAKGPRASRLTLIEEAAAAFKLTAAMKRVEPDEQQRLKVWFESASYEALVQWFDQLAGQGIQVQGLSMDHLEEPGLVNARVTMAGGR